MLRTFMKQCAGRKLGIPSNFLRSICFSSQRPTDLTDSQNEIPGYPIAGAPPVQWKSASEAIEAVKSGDQVFVQGFASTPTVLLEALCKHARQHKLKDITLHHLQLEGPITWGVGDLKEVRSRSLFTGPSLRSAVSSGDADYVPIFLSEIPQVFGRGFVNLDVAIIHVSPPDKMGFCSLGTSIDCTMAAVTNAKYIIALANPYMPRTFGDGIIHESHVDVMVFGDWPLYEREMREPDDVDQTIGKLISDNLVEDEATLQIGIGAIPASVLSSLKNHRDLGIHTEMFSDGQLGLIECAAVTNSKKVIHPGKVVASFAYGSRRLYDFIDDNPMFVMGDVSWVNDASVIRRNPKVTAINSCVEVDITGQVASDSIGTHILSGFGGQVDFIRGASLCNDGRGKPILALRSTTKDGKHSKIVSELQTGGGVVTSRAQTHYVVTEYGIAQLFSRNLRQRAYELIKIAHPDHREQLEKNIFERLKVMPSAD